MKVDNVWKTHIKSLKGHKVLSVIGRENLIIDVANKYLERLSSKGKKSNIDKRIFEDVLIGY